MFASLSAAINAVEGGFVHPSLTLRPLSTSPDDRGLFAKSRIESGTEIIKVPASLVIGPGAGKGAGEGTGSETEGPSPWLRTVEALMASRES